MISVYIILRNIIFECFLIQTPKGLSCWSESSVIRAWSPNWNYLECLFKELTLSWEIGRYLLGSLHIIMGKGEFLLIIQTMKLVSYSWFWYTLHSLISNVSIGICCYSRNSQTPLLYKFVKPLLKGHRGV